MIVYVVINETSESTNIIGIYRDREFALSQYEKYINNGRYTIFPMIIDQTVVNVGQYGDIK